MTLQNKIQRHMTDQPEQIKNHITLFVLIEVGLQRCISAAIFNERQRKFQLVSIGDNEHYSNFESLLLQLNPKENDEIFTIFYAINNVLKTERQKILDILSQFPQDNVHEEKFNRSPNQITHMLEILLVRNPNIFFKQLSHKKSYVALQHLLAVLKLDKETNKKQMALQTLKINNFMRIDKAVVNALQIFPNDLQNNKAATHYSSTLFEILNKCKTKIGTRCLKQWMKQPLQDKELLNKRLNKVQFFIDNPEYKQLINNELKKIPDLNALYHVFYKVHTNKKSNVGVNDLLKISTVIKVLTELVKKFEQRNSKDPIIVDFFQELKDYLEKMVNIKRLVDDWIDFESLDKKRQERDDSDFLRKDKILKPKISQKLLEINDKKEKMIKKIEKHKTEIQQTLEVPVKFGTSQRDKFIFEADKKKSYEKVRELYKYLTARQNKITFTTQDLTFYCKELTRFQKQYEEESKKILEEMYIKVAEYYPVLQKLSHLLSQIDVLIAFSSVASERNGLNTPWKRPIFSQNRLKGSEIHHPCVYKCVYNNFDSENNRTVIITGPNMGGKSTYIRTIGIAVYLAHIGCYVPANQFETPIVDSIITRVGASDMQIKGISTFMSEMIESSCMLKSATERSLVLIDELGRGTSTAQGFGIAWAICHELHTQIRPYCLFATHFHEMTKMSDEVEGVCNMYTACKFENNKLNLEYRVLHGKMLKSYGLEVAKMLNFPKQVVTEAKIYLSFYQKEKDELQEQLQKLQFEEEVARELTKKQIQMIRCYKEMKTKIAMEDSANKQVIQSEYKQIIRNILNPESLA